MSVPVLPLRPLRRREAAFNLPLGLVVAIAILLGIHAGRPFLPEETEVEWLFQLGFVPAPVSVAAGFATTPEVVAAAIENARPGFEGVTGEIARFLVETRGPAPWSALTYVLLHGSWLHVGLNTVWLAAFGAPVLRRCGTGRGLVLAIVTALAGAGAQWLSNPLGIQPMIGVSAVVSGFMAAAATFAFAPGSHLGAAGAPRPAALRRVVESRGAVLFLGSWFVFNLLFGLLAGPLGLSEGGIAWQAHIGGLVAGLLVYPWLDRVPTEVDGVVFGP